MFLMLGSLAQAASFTARADRYQLQPGESLLLTLELDQPDYFVDPDIEPLQQDFELISSSHQPLIEENGHAYSRWLLRLQPRREGNLTIPALRLGELLSAPLRIEVKTRATGQPASLEPVYIDSSLDREELYVQAQAVLTVKIHHSIPLYSDGQLSPLTINGARVHSLGEPATYQQYIHGIRYGVIEMRYAIFPQSAGTLTIAPQTFAATLAGDDASSINGPQLTAPGRKIEVKSAQIPLVVKPPPPGFPANAIWLPARQLSLHQQLSPTDGSIHPDQVIERRLTLDIEGLPAGFLPALLPEHVTGFRTYSNPVEHAQKETATGMHTQTQEQQLLVALQAGTTELPALQLPWWNTESDTLEWATAPAQSLQVVSTGQSENLTPHTTGESIRTWQLVSLTLALLCLLLAFLWRRARRLPAIIPPAPAARKSSRLLEELKKACINSQPQQARTLLDQWLRQHDYHLTSLARTQPELQTAMRELNQALYSPSEQNWDGDQLWHAVTLMLERQQQNNSQQLPPLYPP